MRCKPGRIGAGWSLGAFVVAAMGFAICGPPATGQDYAWGPLGSGVRLQPCGSLGRRHGCMLLCARARRSAAGTPRLQRGWLARAGVGRHCRTRRKML
jgi:hypothetical protein